MGGRQCSVLTSKTDFARRGNSASDIWNSMYTLSDLSNVLNTSEL